jgi:hypothetical protein
MNKLRKQSGKIIPFMTASKTRQKQVGINLNKNVKDLYNENCKKEEKMTLEVGMTFHVYVLSELVL